MKYSLLIANDFPPVTSGIATVFDQIWRRLPAGRTRILAPRCPGSEAFDRRYPVPVHRLRLPLGEGPRAKLGKTLLSTLWILLRAVGDAPGHLHCGQVFSSGIAGWLCKRVFNIPYTVWVYGSETIRLASTGPGVRLMETILDESQWVITNSNATSEEYRAFGVPGPKIRRVYPGVDPDTFCPVPPDRGWIERLQLSGKKVLLTVARLDQRKGHDMVLRALKRLQNTHDVVYLIGGKGREEPRLRSLADELGLRGRVHFLGFVPNADLPVLYNLCDAFVMPNRVTRGTALAGDIEGFGITFVEAGACEKPVVAGRSGGALEAVLDGETGLVVDPHSPEEIAGAINRLFSNPEYASRLGRQARQRIEREFDWRILARLVEEIL